MVAYYRSRRSQAGGTITHNVPAPQPTEPSPPEVTVDYPTELVPSAAKDVVAWIGEAVDDPDRQARARVALEVENGRTDRRKTVTDAVASVLG